MSSNSKFSPRGGPAMVEIVIVFAFFLIMSVFLLRIFGKTETVRNDADKTSHAVIRAESVLEYIFGAEDEGKALKDLGLKSIVAGDDTYLVRYYDKDWNETEDVGKYVMTLRIREDDSEGLAGLVTYSISIDEVNVFDNSGQIFDLTAKKYTRE